MSGGNGAPEPKHCRYSQCGKVLLPPPPAHNRQERFYCDPTCRDRAYHERHPEAKKERKRYALTCQYTKCGKPFEGVYRTTKYCKGTCATLDKAERERERIDRPRRDAAVRTALRRSRRELCPDCGSALGADLTLLYCAARCGWDELLTRHERDPRADTPDPTTDEEAMKEPTEKPETTDEIDEEEEEEEELEEDEDEEEEEPEEDEGPAPKRKGKPAARGSVQPRILALLRERPGLPYGEVRKALGLATGTASGALSRAKEAGLIVLKDGGYHLKGKAAPAPEPKAAPKAPPAPAAKAPAAAPAPKPAPRPKGLTAADALALVRRLPPAERDALLDALTPAVAARSSVQTAQRVLDEELQKLGAGL